MTTSKRSSNRFGARKHPISRFSRTVSVWNTFRVWGTKPTPRWTSLCAGCPVMSSPLRRIEPERTETIPSIALSSVDLPAPLGPMIPTNSPGATVRSQPLRMLTSGT